MLDNTDPGAFYMLTNVNSGGKNWQYCKSTHGTDVVVSPLGGSGTVPHCASPLLDKIMPKARQIMYTDGDNVPFLAATFLDGGQAYWNELVRQTTTR